MQIPTYLTKFTRFDLAAAYITSSHADKMMIFVYSFSTRVYNVKGSSLILSQAFIGLCPQHNYSLYDVTIKDAKAETSDILDVWFFRTQRERKRER